MTSINLNGRIFSPASNTRAGRVNSDALFKFSQRGRSFQASYEGDGFTDGHLIGNFTELHRAVLVYHCRAATGELEVGEADAVFQTNKSGLLQITMQWQWLNGSKATGTSFYEEIT